MSGKRGGIVSAAAVILGVIVAAPASAQDGPKARPFTLDPDKVLADADAAEKAGRYEKALELYLKVYTAGRTDPELRDRIRACFRNASQIERHRDPAFQQFVLSLSPADALALYAEALEKINKLYADRERSTVEKLFAAGLDELDHALSSPAFRQTHLADVPAPKIDKFRQNVRDGWRTKLPATHKEAALSAREMVSAAGRQLGLKNGSAVVLELLCGACGGLDEFSAYVAPTGPQAELASPIIELATYGLLVRHDPKGLLIDAVVPGSWAAVHTKLAKGDRVMRVNGKVVSPSNPAVLLDALRSGPPFAHELELPPTDGEMTATRVRLPRPLPTVYAVDMADAKAGVGYLRLAAFKEQTPRELDDAVMELKARGMKVLVIDLRGNAGGLFTSAVSVAKMFLPSGLIVATHGQSPEFAERAFSSDSGMAAYDVPLVLLVDTKTMSSAEILAAGLKDNLRATLVGLPTFGKGLIQAPIRLQAMDGPDATPTAPGNKSGVLILSVAAAVGPRGAGLNGTGVTPHFTEANPERQLTVAIQKAVEMLQGAQPMPMVMR